MGLSSEYVNQVKEEFQEEYLFKEPLFSLYVNTCGISKVGIRDKNALIYQQDDFCISVGLRSPLPPDLLIPKEYRGVRVFVRVIDETRPL